MPQATDTQSCVRPARVHSCFLRGSHVRFMVLPDILKNAPFFKKIETKQARDASNAARARSVSRVLCCALLVCSCMCLTRCGRACHRVSQAKQAAAKSASKAKQAAQQRATGRRDVGMPEKQKERERKKNPSFN